MQQGPLSRSCLFSGLYQQISAGALFEASEKKRDFEAGIQLRNGIKKGVRVTKEGGKATALLVVDMKVRRRLRSSSWA